MAEAEATKKTEEESTKEETPATKEATEKPVDCEKADKEMKTENGEGDTKADKPENEDEKLEEKGTKKEIVMTPELEKKIIRQIEFYFGDLNLARDHFMQGEIKENDGWITMETMLKFNRLKNLCDDAAKVVQAAKTSTSGLLEFSEDEQKVRRSTAKPVPSNTEERRADLKARTCYVKGFPTEFDMDALLNFFDQHCSTELIQMRRTAKKEFKGSVFVIFPTKEEAKKFLDLAEMTVTGVEEPLKKMWKDDYFQMKLDLRKKGKKVQAEADAEKKKEDDEERVREKMTKGAILHLVGMAPDTTRDELKNAFGEHKVAWADFEKGDTDAWLRFDEEDSAQKAWDAVNTEGKMVLRDSEITADVLEGEPELNHWRNMLQARADRYKKRSGRGRGGGRGHWGGKGRSRDNDGPASKRARRD